MAFFRSKSARNLALRSLPFALLAASLPAAAVGCSKEPTSAALMLVMSTNMELPDDVGAVGLYVKNGDVTVFEEVHETYQVTDPVSGATRVVVDLPATFAVRPPAGGSASVVVRVVAYDKNTGAPVVLRTAQSIVPTDRIGILRMPLDWMNQTTTAQTATADTTPIVPTRAALERYGLHLTADPQPTGKKYISPGKVLDCNTADAPDALVSRAGGLCGTATFADSNEVDLPSFDPLQIWGAPDLQSANCFDAAACLGKGPSAIVDLDALDVTFSQTGSSSVSVTSCTYTLPDPAPADEANMNVALLTPERTGGAVRGKCVDAPGGKGKVCVALVTNGTGLDNWRYDAPTHTLRLPNGYCSDSFRFRNTAKLLIAYGDNACHRRKINEPFCVPGRVTTGKAEKPPVTHDLPIAANVDRHLDTAGVPISLDAAQSKAGPIVYAVSSVNGLLKVDGSRPVACGGEANDFAPAFKHDLPASDKDAEPTLRIGVLRKPDRTESVLSFVLPGFDARIGTPPVPPYFFNETTMQFTSVGSGSFVSGTSSQGVSYFVASDGSSMPVIGLYQQVFGQPMLSSVRGTTPAVAVGLPRTFSTSNPRFLYSVVVVAPTAGGRPTYRLVKTSLDGCPAGSFLYDCAKTLTLSKIDVPLDVALPSTVDTVLDLQVQDDFLAVSVREGMATNLYGVAFPKFAIGKYTLGGPYPITGQFATDSNCIYAISGTKLGCIKPGAMQTATPVTTVSEGASGLAALGGTVFWGEQGANGGVVKCFVQLPTDDR